MRSESKLSRRSFTHMNDRSYKLTENKSFTAITASLRPNRIKIDISNFTNEKFFAL